MIGKCSRRWQGGGSGLEFALALPVLLGFVLAGLDIANLVSQVQRANAAAAAAADLATQIDGFIPETRLDRISTGRELAVLALAATEAARPQNLLTDGTLIVTSVGNTGSGPAIAWQQRWGRADLASTLGTGFGGLNIQSGEGVVIAEVAMKVRPWRLTGHLLGLPDELVLRRTAMRRPRLSVPLILSPR